MGKRRLRSSTRNEVEDENSPSCKHHRTNDNNNNENNNNNNDTTNIEVKEVNHKQHQDSPLKQRNEQHKKENFKKERPLKPHNIKESPNKKIDEEILVSSQDEADEDDEDSDYDTDDDYLPSSQEYLAEEHRSQPPSPPQWYNNNGRKKRRGEEHVDTREEYEEYRDVMRYAEEVGKSWLTRAKRKERESRLWEELEPDTGHTIFPNEIWDKIFRYLPVYTLRCSTLVCKNLRYVANRYLWTYPEFCRNLDVPDLESIACLPIKRLKTCDLEIRKSVPKAHLFANIFGRMDSLTELIVCFEKATQNLSLASLEIISPFVTSLSTDAVTLRSSDGGRSGYVEKLKRMHFPKLKHVVLKKEQGKSGGFTAADITSLARVLPVTEIWTSVLNNASSWNRYHYHEQQRFQFLSELSGCLQRVVVCEYSLHIKDAEMLRSMREKGVEVELLLNWNYRLAKQLEVPC